MSELIKSYDNAAGRTCEVRYDTARLPRPFWVDARCSMKGCLSRQSAASAVTGATYRTQVEAEHAAAHFLATGDLPMAKNAQKPREGVDATPGAVSVPTPRPKRILQRLCNGKARPQQASPALKQIPNPKF